MSEIGPICKQRSVATANQSEFLQCRPDDLFFIPDWHCNYRKIISGIIKKGEPCFDHASFLQNIPSSFLAEPTTQQRLNQMLALASFWNVPEEELIAVFNNALPEYSIPDRILRVRSYLLFHIAKGMHYRLAEDPGFSASRNWKLPVLSDDFENYVDQSMQALRSNLGNPNIQETEEIKSAAGSLLSGDYEALKKKIRFSAFKDDFFSDWAIYVQFHEFYHWYDFRNNPRFGNVTIEDREWSASKMGMKALILFKNGPVSFLTDPKEKKKNEFEEEHEKIKQAISKLPVDLQVPFQVVYEKIRGQIESSSHQKFLHKLHQVVLQELATGHTEDAAEKEGRLLLRQWRFAREMWADFRSFATQDFFGKVSPLSVEVTYFNKLHFKSPLVEILSMASYGQIPLAIHRLNELFDAHSEYPILALE
ncbi:MAG: hypothetical protein Q8P84_06835 [Deltaproteobacteria bacterium]|nr:hypothetical protein [Deltaproteobacteria bacterium]